MENNNPNSPLHYEILNRLKSIQLEIEITKFVFFVFGVLLAILILFSCSPTNAPTEPPFIGSWEAKGTGGTVSMRFDEGGQYLAAFVSPLDTASEIGRWHWREPLLITSPTECREGFALRLMLCEGSDTVRVAIDGDEWTVRFSATETVTLLRVHHK